MPSADTAMFSAPLAPGFEKPPKAVLVRRGSRGLSNCDADGSPLPVDSSEIDLMSLKTLFMEQRTSVDFFWDHLDYDVVQKFAQACVECKGVICFTGVGKSGFIAHKISQTLVSTGTKSVFLSPTDALHGDIGILSEHDLLVLLYKDDDSDELLKLVPYAKAKGARLACVTTSKDSPLNSMCDLSVVLPFKRELCPFNMEPVTSTGIQILFGDTVAIALMKARKVSQTEYAMNHPAGKIGKQLILHVSDIMASGSGIPMVNERDQVVDVLLELSAKAHGCVVVTDSNNRLLGTFTDGDLRRTLQTRGEETLGLEVAEVMHREPKTVKDDMMAVDAMSFMNDETRRVSFLPVVNAEGCIAGVLTLHMCVMAGL